MNRFALFSYKSRPKFRSSRNNEQEKRTQSVHRVRQCTWVRLSTLHSNWSPLFATQVQLYCLASLPRIRHSQSDRPEQENKASGSDTKSEALFKLSHYFLNHSCCLGQFESVTKVWYYLRCTAVKR
jgi:hypothetical protein